MFHIFCEKFETSKWSPFWARQNFFENWDHYSAQIPCGSKISLKSLYLAQFLRYKHFCVLQFMQKMRKFEMAASFDETKLKKKIGLTTLQRYPMDKKFRRNCSISHGFRDISIFVFSLFGKFVMINLSLITRPFLNQAMPKSNDFQSLIE